MIDSNLGMVIGFLLLLVLILASMAAIFTRSKASRTLSLLSEHRKQLRTYQTGARQLAQSALAFSPEDPDPFGGLSEKFNQQSFEFERLIALSYQAYSQLHQRANQLRSSSAQLFMQPYEWFELNKQVSSEYQNLNDLEQFYLQLVKTFEELDGLCIEVSNQTQATLARIHEIRQLFHSLSPLLTGDLFEGIGEKLANWEKTFKTQVPLTFLSTQNLTYTNAWDKETVSRVHRILRAAKPEIASLSERLKGWKSDFAFLETNIELLQRKSKMAQDIISELEQRDVSPVLWDKSKKASISIGEVVKKLTAIHEPCFIEELREKIHQMKGAQARLEEIEAACAAARSNYGELMSFWSSMELQQGFDWIKGVKLALEKASAFDAENWKAAESIDDFQLQFTELCTLQEKLLPIDPAKPIRETELPNLLERTRRLTNLHLKLRSRYKIIHARLLEIQNLQGQAREKLTGAKIVLSKTIPMISSNPIINKLAGNEPVKMLANLEILLNDLESSKVGIIENKVQKSQEWIAKAEQAYQKWLDALALDLDGRLSTLDQAFQTLGNFVNIEDLVVTEVKEIILKEARGVGSIPLTRPGDEPLMVSAKKLWEKNDRWQRIVSASRAFQDVADPVLERYNRAVKSRESARKLYERGNELIPAEFQWPPTTQNLNIERKQWQNLENGWQGLEQEHIQAIQLVGKLSDFSERYKELESQLDQAIKKAEQEQEKALEYERKLEASKTMWLGVVAKNPDIRTLKGDVEQLFAEVDRDLENLKRSYLRGGLPYHQVLQNLRQIGRKLNEAAMPAIGNQLIDINNELQRRLY